MTRLLLLSFFTLSFSFFALYSHSQQGYLFVKKGFHKKRVYTEGDNIKLRLEDGSLLSGTITLLRNDTIFLNGYPVPRPLVAEIILERKPNPPPPDIKTLLLIGAGSALTMAGLALSHQASPEKAAIAGLVIGFGPLLVRHFGVRVLHLFVRKKYRIGKKYRLQVLDFHLPVRNLRAF
jgi:hypothetical protein